jgi:hypothetical protein
MSQLEVLDKMLNDMNRNIDNLDKLISEKKEFIEHTKIRIEELNSSLIKESGLLLEYVSKREKMINMQEEVQSNYIQIENSINNLVDILKTKI